MSTIPAVITSVTLSVIMMSALTLYVLPDVSQELDAPLSQEDDDGHPSQEDEGIVLQSMYWEWKSYAVLSDSQTAGYVQVPDTELTITVEQGSQIYAVFSSHYILNLEDLPGNTELKFNISLVVEGYDFNETIAIKYFDSASVNIKRISSTLYIDILTSGLPAGSYTVSVWWVSQTNPIDLNSLRLSDSNDRYSRSLLVQEFKGP